MSETISKDTDRLDLNNKNLREIPSEIFENLSAKYLYLNGNNLDHLPDHIEKLKQLEVLDLGNNSIKKIPPSIGKLRNLRCIYLSNNKIDSLPIELFNCVNLRTLYLTNNNITKIPEQIGKLKKLLYLYAGGNKLDRLPKTIGRLHSLLSIHVNDNHHLTEIPTEIGNIPKLHYIGMYGCNITSIPAEIMAKGNDDVLKYFRAFAGGQETTVLNEAKLIIVGAGHVGKTYLMNKLIYNEIDPLTVSTEGIEINKWLFSITNDKKFRINFWDFGGQEIYHSTHQFFLTKRSLYLFAWEAGKDGDLISFDYWLNTIRLLSRNSPVLVVQTKSDERIKNINESSLQQQFDGIKEFHTVSAITGEGVSTLTKSIKKRIQGLEHVGDKLPQIWADIRTYLEEIQKDYISYEEYLNICDSYKLDVEKAIFLSQYYHDLGVFLHFSDNDILKEILFLKPEWATNAVYKLVDTKEVIKNFGKFTYAQLRSIWNEYPKDKFFHLLELMKKFELCFQIENSQTYIIPDLLKPEMPAFEWESESNVIFEYHYSFMPAGIIARLIVRLHDILRGDLYWKTGAVFEIIRKEKVENKKYKIMEEVIVEETRALVEFHPFQRKITIKLFGSDKSTLLGIIRRDIDYINKSLNNPENREMIPCSCKECKKLNTPFYFNYNNILKAKEKGKQQAQCQTSFEEIPIVDLLGYINKRDKNSMGSGHIHFHKHDHYNRGREVKISKVEIKESQVNFADQIEKITYSPQLVTDKDNFETIKEFLLSLSGSNLEELTNIVSQPTDTTPNNSQNKLLDFLSKNGLAIGQGLSTAALYETLKYLLGL